MSMHDQTSAGETPPPEREVRFAVVIYGGVSLTVYINGVVQEMLHMVRSTWLQGKDLETLTPVEKIYRALARLVGERQDPVPEAPGTERRRRELRHGKVILREQETTVRRALDDDKIPIRTKFVVDILSGTSAGGINAIYLAKALVNNLSLDSLSRLWITAADLDRLLNDTKIKPPSLQQSPPTSLLSGRWMYRQLLSAFQAMNPKEGEQRERVTKTLVNDLDLYCTTTDLKGIEVKIALTDEGVPERRFRNFYHFKHRVVTTETTKNHFTPDMDPFLAFAARCTSSFPFAFEPMALKDVAQTLRDRKEFGAYQSQDTPDPDAKDMFGSEIGRLGGAGRFAQICGAYQLVDSDPPGGFSERAFGDGGYLDNKPFTYAIQTLKERHADVPVDRKLIYIEPNPERFTDPASLRKQGQPDRPNAIENSLDALVVLPRYETIRQDIQSVIDWNTNLARLQRVLATLDGPIKSGADPGPLAIESYRRLRFSGAADQLACRLAEAIRVDAASAEGEAVRALVGKWRDRNFPGQDGQQGFLDLFDFDYCERAIRFLRGAIQSFLKGEDRRVALWKLSRIFSRFMEFRNDPLILKPSVSMALECWRRYLRFIIDPKFAASGLGEDRWEFRCDGKEHFLPKPGVNDALMLACNSGRDNRVDWLFKSEDTTRILQFDSRQSALVSFKEIVTTIDAEVRRHFGDVNNVEKLDEDPTIDISNITPLKYLRQCMAPLFDQVNKAGGLAHEQFHTQDVLVYPIIFGTDVGEFEPVDIFRISPKDTTPISGTAPAGSEEPSPPLRGTSFADFGAFLDADWRLSDMLRGRLDGAERLITAILPDSDARTVAVREDLIGEAQQAIAQEWSIFLRELNLKRSSAKQRMADDALKTIGEFGVQEQSPSMLEDRPSGDQAIDDTASKQLESRQHGGVFRFFTRLFEKREEKPAEEDHCEAEKPESSSDAGHSDHI